MYTKLQLRKSETIGEMFNVTRKVALVEGSAQDTHFKKKDKFLEGSSNLFYKRGKIEFERPNPSPP